MLSINWGLWSQVGMGTSAGDLQYGKDEFISPEEGIQTLAALMANGRSRAAVLPMNWTTWQERYPAFAAAPLLRDVVSGQPVGQAATRSRDRPRSKSL